MDPRLEINDPPRPVLSGVESEVPLVTIVWRSLQRQCDAIGLERRQQAREKGHLQEALVQVAREVHRLRTLPEAETFSPLATRLEQILAEAGVEIVAPVGEPYDEELAEYLSNEAQVSGTDHNEPYVAEVIEPAILYRGEMVQAGKVVVGVPE